MYSSSHLPQQPSHHLPLAKFSHTATSIGHNGPLNWNHIIGNGDLELILEKNKANGALSGRNCLKVVQDHHTWEELDLDRLIQEASNINQKPMSAVIVRLPCIAVKYPNGQLIRRFQVKFRSDGDYYSALTILSEMQCPFSESNIGPPQLGRKLTSSWNTGLGIGSISGTNSAVSQSNFSTACSSGTMSNILRPHSASSFSSHIPADFTGPVNTQNYSIQQHQMPTPLNSCASSSTISRPSTATAHYDPEAVNKTLPPKRSLPFATPGAKKPRTAAKAKQLNPQPVQNKQAPSLPVIEQQPTAPMTNAITFPSSQITQPCQSIQLGESAEYPFASSQSDKSLLTSTDLTAYLSNPTSERTAIIQNWVCNLVQDDGFLQLCEDVEGAWGRIALGKRADQFN